MFQIKLYPKEIGLRKIVVAKCNKINNLAFQFFVIYFLLGGKITAIIFLQASESRNFCRLSNIWEVVRKRCAIR